MSGKYKKYFKLQNELSKKLILENGIDKIETVAGVDVSYVERVKKAFATVVIFNFQNLKIVEKEFHISDITFPYIPGLLSFREIPPLLECIKKCNIEPDLYICDGQGIAHPRKLGLASHLGIILNKTTIGCAKKKLVGEFSPPPMKVKSWSPLWYKNEMVGGVLRSKVNVKPIFVSPGNKIDVYSSIEIVKRLITKYKLPEPTRIADKYTGEIKRSYLG